MTGRAQGLQAVVVGAGIGGLAAALALAQRGADVLVLEQATALQEVGAGIQISPNGRAVLHALGLGAAVAQASLASTGVELFDGLSARRVLRMGLFGWRAGAFLHRADLIGLVAGAAQTAGVRIEFNSRVRQIDLSGDRPLLHLADGSRQICDLLVGADGLKSRIHGELNGAIAPFFTRQAAWRAVIPELPGADPVAQIHMGPGRHLVTYPLRGGRARNIVAVEERDDWLAEGWAQQDDPANLRRAFAGFSPQVQDWLARVDQVGLWGLFRHPVARYWTRALPSGGIALLGDAAHPTLPFLAQGANMALEDAFVLADVVDRQGLTPESLAQYQAIRAPRCRAIVDAATGNARLYHLHSPWRGPAYLGLSVAGRVAPGLFQRRYDWIWGKDVTAQEPVRPRV